MMKALVLAVVLSCSEVAVAFSPPHPCFAYPSKVSKLSSCATASSFCSSVLGGPASFTRTHTTTSTSTLGPDSTTVTTQETSSTTSYTSTTTTSVFATVTTVYTSTVTTTSSSCATTTANPVARRNNIANNGLQSCGIPSTANQAKLSGACNCILASKTTTTEYATTQIPGTATDTETQDPTTTTIVTDSTSTKIRATITRYSATVTTTTCATPTFTAFYLQVQAPLSPMDGRYIAISQANSDDYQVNTFPDDMTDASIFMRDIYGKVNTPAPSTTPLFMNVIVPNINGDGNSILYFDAFDYIVAHAQGSYPARGTLACNPAADLLLHCSNGPGNYNQFFLTLDEEPLLGLATDLITKQPTGQPINLKYIPIY